MNPSGTRVNTSDRKYEADNPGSSDTPQGSAYFILMILYFVNIIVGIVFGKVLVNFVLAMYANKEFEFEFVITNVFIFFVGGKRQHTNNPSEKRQNPRSVEQAGASNSHPKTEG